MRARIIVCQIIMNQNILNILGSNEDFGNARVLETIKIQKGRRFQDFIIAYNTVI